MIGQISTSGVSLVVPAYFICAGILVGTGITATVVSLYRSRMPLHLAFAATCYSSAGITMALAFLYLSSTVEGAIEVSRWGWYAADLFVASVVVFIAIYADFPQRRRAYALVGVLAAVFLTVNTLLPLGQRFAVVESFSWIQLPWGEALFQIRGPMTGWAIAFRVASVAAVAWSVWNLQALHQRGRRRDALVLAVYLVTVFAASVHGLLIDVGQMRTFHSVPFALVGLALLMSLNLGMRIREQNSQLASTLEQLRAENERRHEAEHQLLRGALTDPLTQLPNRFFIQERLSSLMEHGPEQAFGAVLICDLDHFKTINNALSHEVGDQLLAEVSARLLQAARGQATVARLGGNTFMAMLDTLHRQEADARTRIAALAEEVLAGIARTARVGEHSIDLTASIGVATFASRGTTTTEVMAHADMALHRAKKRGRSNIQAFVPEFRSEADERFRVVEGLRRARAAGELALHFQAQVDLEGRMTGAEALMRWNSPAMGMVSPATFIPIAEETGLIHSLGQWSLRTGCERMAAWKREGAGFAGHLSINVSPWQLARADFVATLVEEIEASGVDPASLMLEITESAVLFDVAETVAKLRDIRPLGVRIALDDFGTGYSSLALIKDLPLDAIKIDQSFVRHIAVGANMHLVRMVVAIGSELGIDVIAEGVETAAQRDILAGLGCQRLQGYLFGRPLPQDEFTAWMLGSRPETALAQTLSA